MRRSPLRPLIILSLAVLLLIFCRAPVSDLIQTPTLTETRAVSQASRTPPPVTSTKLPIKPTSTQSSPAPQSPVTSLDAYPEGELIFFAEGLGIYRMNANGYGTERMENLPADATYPFLSPSGKRLGFFSRQTFGDNAVSVIGVLENGQVYLPSARASAQCLSSQPYLAAWSPDEQMVACVSALGGGEKGVSYFVAVTAFDSQSGSTYWRLWSSFQIKGVVQMTWMPDSRGLVFIIAEQGTQHFYLARLGDGPLGLDEQQQLVPILADEMALSAQVLPGNRLLLAGQNGIYILASNETNPALITKRQTPYQLAAFNADGRFAAVFSTQDNGLHILDLLSSADRRVGDIPNDLDPLIASQFLAWSPDGQYLTFTMPNELVVESDDLFLLKRDGPVTFLRSIPRLRQIGQYPVSQVLWHPRQPYFLFQEHIGRGFSLLLGDAQAAGDGQGMATINPFQANKSNQVNYTQVSWRAGLPALQVVELPLAPPACRPLPGRLNLNNSVYSSIEPPVVSLIYRQASFTSAVVGSLSPGEAAWVLEGPTCSQDTNFWLLRAKRGGTIGWAAEASQGVYVLAPRPDALLFTSKGKVYALPLDGTGQHLVADPAQVIPGIDMLFSSPGWSPVGDYFSYLGMAPDFSAAFYVQAYIAGTAIDLLSSLALSNISLPIGAWSPDGSRVVVSLGPKNENRDLYLLQADGSLVQNLTGSPTLDDRSPSWSPDGKLLAYLSGTGKDTEIYVIAPGESITRISNNQTEELSPAWSTSSNRIAYVELDNGEPFLYTMNPDGSERTLLNSQRGWSPAWSPDGSMIAFTDPGGDRLFLVNSNGQELRLLALAGDDKFPVQPVWAPAGGRLAYVYQDTLYIFNLATNTTTPVAFDLDNPFIAWQP